MNYRINYHINFIIYNDIRNISCVVVCFGTGDYHLI